MEKHGSSGNSYFSTETPTDLAISMNDMSLSSDNGNKKISFVRYNPNVPQLITTRKGYQKLVYQGHIYNIFQLVPDRNFKSWRCVRAMKMSDDGLWCKCRAETTMDDNNVYLKGIHSHLPEHRVAEIKFMRAQLFVAAVENPGYDAGELINQASMYLSDEVSFDSKENLRESIENLRESLARERDEKLRTKTAN